MTEKTEFGEDFLLNNKKLLMITIIILLLTAYAGYKFRTLEEEWIVKRANCINTTMGYKCLQCVENEPLEQSKEQNKNIRYTLDKEGFRPVTKTIIT